MFEDSWVVWLGVDIVMLLLCACFGFFESGKVNVMGFCKTGR